MRIAQVIVDVKAYSVDRVFDYLIPDTLTVKVGMRVLVPFGARTIDGYVIKITNQPTNKEIKLKEIASVSEIQFLNEELVDLAETFANATASFRTSLLQAMLPKDVTKRKIKRMDVIVGLKKLEAPIRARKQVEVLDYLKTITLPVSLPFLRKVFGASVIAKMIQDDFFVLDKIEEEKVIDPSNRKDKKIKLRAEQEQVLETLIKCDKTGYVLQGVTGSGKTEIFLSYVDYVLQKNQTAIILVPEIGLTPQMIARFEARFGVENIAILHSKLSSTARFDMWLRIKRQQVKIVLGTRSAIFAPLTDIGVIIIDEEHDTSYKQENMPAYNAKDIAYWRAEYHQAKVIFASATPSLESYIRAEKGIYQLLELKERISNQQKEIHIVNMREYIGNIEYRYFSKTLLEAMEKALARKEQVLLLLNRRGYAPLVQCKHCGYTPTCQHCDTNLVYHKDKGRYICHYCQYEEIASFDCPTCHQQLQIVGVGIQKIAEELALLFPNANILRADRDNVKTIDDYHYIYEKFSRKEANILLGTQMIAKGFDFPDVTVVGVLETDQLLHMPDLRAREKAYQLLLQVVGRTGRGEKHGQAFLQTYEPEHELFDDIIRDDYQTFAQKELVMRKTFQNPPFWHVSDIIISAENLHETARCANYIFEQLQPLKQYATIYAPAPTFLKKMNNRYHLHILLKYKNSQIITKNIRILIEHVTKKYPKVRMYLQVNPLTFN